MLKQKVSIYWRVTWAIVTPLFLLSVLLYSLAEMETLTYNKVHYPSEILGKSNQKNEIQKVETINDLSPLLTNMESV